MNDNSRIRPYIDTRIVILLERLREIQGVSVGKILTALLYESETFKTLIENYYDATDKELKKIFLGLPFDANKCKNKQS
ncbi:hypothetical protein [Sulfurimonas hydrogeniphila]|uniref:hypothetical protein n=1 Tax=Sulfurimonas hydrogeniphila TaxID=2509341 RepID=UPI00125F96E0|nr:hypothetical protein [Sulfurimonas hydrogeniphila]